MTVHSVTRRTTTTIVFLILLVVLEWTTITNRMLTPITGYHVHPIHNYKNRNHPIMLFGIPIGHKSIQMNQNSQFTFLYTNHNRISLTESRVVLCSTTNNNNNSNSNEEENNNNDNNTVRPRGRFRASLGGQKRIIKKKNVLETKEYTDIIGRNIEIDNDDDHDHDDDDDDDDDFIELLQEIDEDDKEEQELVPVLQSPTVTTTDTRSVAVKVNTASSSTTTTNKKKKQKRLQYVALEPGTVVQIEVGDISLSRKAWKKRRRTNSPLLIPCSILHINIMNAIRWNCIYLLEKFGTTTTTTSTSSSTSIKDTTNSKMLRISITELSYRYRTHLKSKSLHQYAIQLGYESTYDLLINHIFHKSIQDAYGIQVITSNALDRFIDTNNNDEYQRQQEQYLWLETPLSRQKAHRRAASAAILQFTDHDNMNDDTTTTTTTSNTNSVGGVNDVLDHTGYVRIKNPRRKSIQTDTEANSVESNDATPNLYSIAPLSVALRVSSNDIIDNIVYTGSRHAAVVFDYNCNTMISQNNDNNNNNDDNSDIGMVAPFITLSLNPQRNQVRDRLKLKTTMNSNSNRYTTRPSNTGTVLVSDNVQQDQPLWFNQLKIGDGPYIGRIVRLVKGGAVVDCNVVRHRVKLSTQDVDNITGNNDPNNKKKITDDAIPVLGVLRFRDAVLNNAYNSNDGTNALLEDEIDDIDDDEEDWDDILSIDDLNNVDDMDDDVDDDEEDDDNDDDIDDVDDVDMDTTDIDDGEVLASFNMDNDDEFAEGEDITHLFNIRDDGTLEYTDPVTGVTKIISDVNIQDDHDDDDDDEEEDEDDNDEGDNDDIEEDEDDEDDDEDGPVLLTSFKSTSSTGRSSVSSSSPQKYKTQTLRVGDTVELYIKSVSKQSNQLFLSMDSSIIGMKAKDMKKDNDKQKKLNRLLQQMGGYEKLRTLYGTICNGTIKATSNTMNSNWCYVQPDIENIPVGVATISYDDMVLFADRTDVGGIINNNNNNDINFQVGDTVRIRINGIDNERGQLSMSIIGKYVTIV